MFRDFPISIPRTSHVSALPNICAMFASISNTAWLQLPLVRVINSTIGIALPLTHSKRLRGQRVRDLYTLSAISRRSKKVVEIGSSLACHY